MHHGVDADPSSRRASTIGVDSSTRPTDFADDALDHAPEVRLVAEAHVGVLDAAVTLDVHVVGPVAHDFADGRVLDETVDRSVTETLRR